MSKELTPLQAFDNLCGHLDYDTTDYMFNGGYEEDAKIIETALKRLEKIDNSVKFDMEYYEKRNQALEIIKREPSEVIEIITTYDTWEEYIKDYPISDRTIWHIIKNKSEFDLLKEILK